MIKTVEFRNFKALRHVKLDLAPLNLIVGPNASGKTSVLEGIAYLGEAIRNGPSNTFTEERHPSVLRTTGTDQAMELFAVEQNGGAEESVRVTITLERDADGEAPWSFRAEHNKGDGKHHQEVAGHIKSERVRGGRGPIPASWGFPAPQTIASAILLQLDPRQMTKPSFTEELIPQVCADGGNLAAVLADLKISDESTLNSILAALRLVVPSVKDIAFYRKPIERTTYEPTDGYHGPPGYYEQVRTRAMGYEFSVDYVSGEKIGATACSEGTLLALGLLTLMAGKSPPRLVLIDELERGLHPKALGELVRQIREIQKRFPGMQVIGTTHSPYLVDHFSAEEVILTTLQDDGSVVCGRLNEHPDFERWKDEMKPGELWSTVGEDWLRDKKGKEGE